MSKEGAPLVFEAQDPRGILIRCTLRCWTEHIVREHSALAGCEEHVKSAVITPQYGLIYQDRNFSWRHVYYTLDNTRQMYIKVVVEMDVDGDTGEVVTAFHTPAPPSGEKLIWKPSSR